ncbi:DUF1059 domain-containing protein [Methanosarcina sp. KYL-1]|uniref:DUF1059 domain-containing protein n=1 Tax=Methanosarcina sp. KYL-1 TaxID=2602068 RepID=UPI002101268C|nr:DUF1059 domain-containing protein [Methanosarcina sp. KYL-1]MCQ1534198.1 DUF1059 domain-containing protein [Methanosarcina sp. KYL-1]
MKIVKCGDLGFKCSFMAVGSELEKVEKEMLDHIEEEHKDDLEKMSEDDIHHLKHRISTLLGRSCGCGAL